jgi:phosphinothricin acetyltransferase
LNIRFSENKDLKDIINIYNQAVKAGNATADTLELKDNDRINWFLEHTNDKYPIYILELNNSVIGWGSISPYRKGREGLKETAEISYYLNYNYHGKGYGKKLIEFMMADCKRLGIKNLVALLLEINKKSSQILEGFGFSRWGFLPDIVNLNGVRCGHLIYGKKVGVENEDIKIKEELKE